MPPILLLSVHRRSLRIVMLVVAVLTVVPGGPVAAVESGPATVTGIEVVADGRVGDALSLSSIVPGTTQEAALFLGGAWADDVTGLTIAVMELEDLENGCSAPERRAGDTTCGDGLDQGELSRWLQVTYTAGVEVDDRGQRACRVPLHPPSAPTLLSELAALPSAVPVPATGPMADDDRWCVVMSFHHEDRGLSDNVTQGDVARFRLRVTSIGATVVASDTDERVTGPGEIAEDRDGVPEAGSRSVVPGRIQAASGSTVLGLPVTGGAFLVGAVTGLLLLAIGTSVLCDQRAARGQVAP